LALVLIVSVTACSTTTRVGLPSAELTQMNLRAHDERSTVTLRDGRQLEVEGLQVNVEEAKGRLLRERTVDAEGRAASDWLRVAGDPEPVTLSSREITRVEMRTGEGKGAAIGGIGGLLAGAAIGGGIGYGVGKVETPPCPFLSTSPSSCILYQDLYDSSDDALETAAYTVLGMIIGGVVLGLTGLLIGMQGKKRTYEFEATFVPSEPAAPPVEPAPAP
jgi:hypothetical protein